MEKALQEHTDFVTYLGLYEHKKMLFTLVNATETSLQEIIKANLNTLARNGSFTLVIGRAALKHNDILINFL